MFEKIKERYMKYYVTDAQLERYVTLGVITAEQAESIRKERMEGITSGGGGQRSNYLTLWLPVRMEVAR